MGDEVRVAMLTGAIDKLDYEMGLEKMRMLDAMVVLASVAILEARPLSSRELLMAWREKVAYR